MPRKGYQPKNKAPYSAGRASRCEAKGRNADYQPRSEATAWRREIAGIEEQLQDTTLAHGYRLTLEGRKTVLEHRLKTEVR